MRKRRRKEINGAALKKIERKGVDRGTCPPLMLECRRLEVVFTGLWAAPPSRLRQLISGSGAGGGHNLWQGGGSRERAKEGAAHRLARKEATTQHTHSHWKDVKVCQHFIAAN